MKTSLLLPVIVCFLNFQLLLFGETLVERLLVSYEQIQTVTCEIRRTIETSEANVKYLSRVYYSKPDLIHVHNITPIKRRIISDGTTFYSYVEEAPKGFSRAIEKLDEDMAISLRKVPGTAMDHLLRLKGIAEVDVQPEKGFLARKGYKTDRLFVVLSLDGQGRLARIEFYKTPNMQEKTAQYDYYHFEEVLSGVWIPCLHKTTANIGGIKSQETVRVTNLTVNKPIAKSIFMPGPFFEKVEFVDNFKDIHK